MTRRQRRERKFRFCAEVRTFDLGFGWVRVVIQVIRSKIVPEPQTNQILPILALITFSAPFMSAGMELQ